MRIGSVVLAFAGATVSGGRSGTARATEPVCEGVRLQGAPDLAPEWAAAVLQLRDQLPLVSASGCAAMTLSVDATPSGGARLLAMTADGRFAERAISRPVALAATALGLVASIPQEAPRDVPGGAPDVPSGAREGAAVSSPHAEAPAGPPSRATAPTAHGTEVWVGFDAGLRAGGTVGLPMLDFEARADAFLASWLLSVSLRYAFAVGPDLDDYQYEEIVIAAGAGRRIPVGRGDLELSVLPALAIMNLQWNQDDPDPQSGAATVFRLGGAVRWSSPIGGSWRLTMTADADVAPFNLAHPINLGSEAPSFPVWTAGLRLGACGEVL
jgi:hypothetical protein